MSGALEIVRLVAVVVSNAVPAKSLRTIFPPVATSLSSRVLALEEEKSFIVNTCPFRSSVPRVSVNTLVTVRAETSCTVPP